MTEDIAFVGIQEVKVGPTVRSSRLPWLLPVKGRTIGLSSADLRGEVSLVNVFASWCTACRYEHPPFMRLKAEGTVPSHGINYKDRPEYAADWLESLGNPYTRTGADLDGRVSIDWGGIRRSGDLRDRSRRAHRLQAHRRDNPESSR